MKKQRSELQTALRNNETFLAFLTQEAQSEKYCRLRENAGKTPHPPGEKLYDYVLGWLDEQETKQVREHIALCGDCAHETLRILQIEAELEQDSLEWADSNPVSSQERKVVFASSQRKEQSLPTAKRSSITDNLVRWISPLWEPQWAGQLVTAADIPKQAHSFTSEDGDIKLSCYWKGQYQDEPAYIQITWKARFTAENEIRIRFTDPVTQAIHSEVCLGTGLVGEETFTSDDLGFDPSYARWAISVVLQKA
jgi:hypothetical protein